MSSIVTIRSNLATVSDTLIGDMGIVIPPGGYVETLTDPFDVDYAARSQDLAALASDNAFPGPPDSSPHTLIVGDGTPHGDLFDALDEAERNGFKKLYYGVTGLLSSVEIYEDAGFTVLLYTKTMTYGVTELLTQLAVTRASDGKVFGKLFTYDGSDNLTDVVTYS